MRLAPARSTTAAAMSAGKISGRSASSSGRSIGHAAGDRRPPISSSTWNREWMMMDVGCGTRDHKSRVPHFRWFLAESHPAGPYRESWSDYSKSPQVLGNLTGQPAPPRIELDLGFPSPSLNDSTGIFSKLDAGSSVVCVITVANPKREILAITTCTKSQRGSIAFPKRSQDKSRVCETS